MVVETDRESANRKLPLRGGVRRIIFSSWTHFTHGFDIQSMLHADE
jgi:hypothetical protein